MTHNQHHKKINNKIPAWLYFSLNDIQGKFKTNNPLEIAQNVLNSLVKHYEERKALGLSIQLEPNNYDNAGWYGKCPCVECCNVQIQER